MSARLRILFVAPYEPSALAVRSRLLLGAIAERHDVHVLALRRHAEGPSAATGTLLGTHRSRWLDRTLALRHIADRSYPFQAMAVASRGLSSAVKAAIDSSDYDLVHVEHIRAMPYLPARRRPPVLFDAVDCVSRLFRLAACEQRFPLRWLFRSEAHRLARLEAKAASSVDRVIVASQREAAALQERNPQGRISVITNPVELDRFTPGSDVRAKVVVMTGKMSFHANAVAARWLGKAIWPLIRAQHPDARLVIAGAQPPRSVRRLAAGDVRVTGYVDDLAGTIGSAAVAVAPLPYAVGVQNKVLEAMACSTAVVATPPAVEGLAVSHGREALIADTAEEFATHVNLLLSNRNRARDLGRAGRDYVEQHHSISVLADRLETEYCEMLRQVPRRPTELVRATAGH